MSLGGSEGTSSGCGSGAHSPRCLFGGQCSELAWLSGDLALNSLVPCGLGQDSHLCPADLFPSPERMRVCRGKGLEWICDFKPLCCFQGQNLFCPNEFVPRNTTHKQMEAELYSQKQWRGPGPSRQACFSAPGKHRFEKVDQMTPRSPSRPDRPGLCWPNVLCPIIKASKTWLDAL